MIPTSIFCLADTQHSPNKPLGQNMTAAVSASPVHLHDLSRLVILVHDKIRTVSDTLRMPRGKPQQAAPRRFLSAWCRRTGHDSRLSRHCREPDHKAVSRNLMFLRADTAAVDLCNGPDQGQPQTRAAQFPGAGGIHSKEGLEDPFTQFRGNAGTLVGHGDDCICTV